MRDIWKRLLDEHLAQRASLVKKIEAKNDELDYLRSKLETAEDIIERLRNKIVAEDIIPTISNDDDVEEVKRG